MIAFLSPEPRFEHNTVSSLRFVGDMDGKTIGVVDDTLDIPLVEGLLAHLHERFPTAAVRRFVKPNALGPGSDALIKEVTDECDVAIVGVGR